MCPEEENNNPEPDQQKTILSNDAQEILDIMLSLLKNGTRSFVPPDFIQENEEFKQILAILIATQDFCDALRKGEIDHLTKTKGYTISQLKAVQMELRNLIWQMKEISKGQDYAETSGSTHLTSSFNSMMGNLTSKIQKLRQSKKDYQEISSRDPLTGAFNRNALQNEFVNAVNNAVKKKYSCALFYMDIDFFKKINDTYGHAIGDVILKTFVARIYECKRDTDLCCRLGGEEFLILLPNVIESFISNIDERLRKEITEKEIDTPTGALSMTYSAGVTYFTPETEITEKELLEIINYADYLLYEAKHSGRDKSIIQKYE